MLRIGLLMKDFLHHMEQDLLKRVVQNFIEDKLALMIISNELKEDKEVLITTKNDDLNLK